MNWKKNKWMNGLKWEVMNGHEERRLTHWTNRLIKRRTPFTVRWEQRRPTDLQTYKPTDWRINFSYLIFIWFMKKLRCIQIKGCFIAWIYSLLSFFYLWLDFIRTSFFQGRLCSHCTVDVQQRACRMKSQIRGFFGTVVTVHNNIVVYCIIIKKSHRFHVKLL